MTNDQGASLIEQVKKLLESNLAYSKEIYAMMKKIQRQMLFSRIMSIIYIILIVGPIILSIIFLPNLLKIWLNNYLPTELNQSSAVEKLLNNGNVLKLYQDVLNLPKGQ